MSARPWFSGGVSHFIRDAMVVLIGMDLLSVVVRYLAMRPYADSFAFAFIWSVVYAIAYLFRRRGDAT
jgi:TRAP-type C4-dicarboxylate transport system permease small subunit